MQCIYLQLDIVGYCRYISDVSTYVEVLHIDGSYWWLTPGNHWELPQDRSHSRIVAMGKEEIHRFI